MSDANTTPITTPNTTGGDAQPDTGGAAKETQNTANVQAKGKADKASGQDKAANDTNLTKEEIKELAEQDLDAYVTKKVNGKTERVRVRDLLNQAQIFEASQTKLEKAKAAAQEAAKYKAQLQYLGQVAKQDPARFLKEIGVDPEEFSESTLAAKLKMLEMSPEARRAMELEQELSKYKAQEEQRKQKDEQDKRSKEENEFKSQVDKEVVKAHEEAGLPKARYYMSRIPYLMMVSEMRAKSGEGEPITAKEAAEIAKNDFDQEYQEVIDKEPINQLAKRLEKRSAELRDFWVGQLQNQGAPKQKTESKPAKPKEPKFFTSDKDYREWVSSL
jgi:hypothetical protein